MDPDVASTIGSLKRKCLKERRAYVKEKMKANRESMRMFYAHLLGLSSSRNCKKRSVSDKDVLHAQVQRAIKDGQLSKSSSVKLPPVEKIPPYTTWVYIDRNQQMMEDQSVDGQTRIYFDRKTNETLICSDSDEEEIHLKEEKHEFSKDEDLVIRETVNKHGASDPVYEALAESIDVETDEIKERYENLMKQSGNGAKNMDLTSAMDSVHNLFCRRCLVFDCQLHGYSQPLVFPMEKPAPYVTNSPLTSCGPNCFHAGVKVEQSAVSNWSNLDKDLYKVGLEMFARNSCLIARNLLKGSKSCAEVGHYMQLDADATHEFMVIDDAVATVPKQYNGRKRGRIRKLKSGQAVKTPNYPKTQRRGNGRLQFTPCSCSQPCEERKCSCFKNGTFCEKYCGCLKSCTNRFKGCSCKSSCSSRQCLCFAAERECDPDVCKNCSFCFGDCNAKCRNMKILLKQHQGILLGISDVIGWGAFLKHPVDKDEYLGEYTGELISERESELRGKVYTLENSSFLFDLNEVSVLDARRQGNKLKFANHSLEPNCYAKVIMVSGDHKVAIFSKKRIEAGEELFFNYGNSFFPVDSVLITSKNVMKK